MRQERRKSSRRKNDGQRANDTETILTNGQSPGGVYHDERGDAHWAWATEQRAQESIEKTFNEFKALDNEALALLEQPDPTQKKPLGGGYNPYDVTAAPKKPARTSRR